MTVDEAQERARTERLAQLGTWLAGFAHEIRNPLSTIGLNLQLVKGHWLTTLATAASAYSEGCMGCFSDIADFVETNVQGLLKCEHEELMDSASADANGGTT